MNKCRTSLQQLRDNANKSTVQPRWKTSEGTNVTATTQGTMSEGQIVESNWFPKRYDGFFWKKRHF